MSGDRGEGAILVVGGGIGGIQASLDLAEAGFYVYLVEEASAIGGKMAQLDKTFPTNDCAMCMLSPKLVEAGRHLNIEILTDTEVLSLAGGPGDFSVKLRRAPRYIDMDRCIGCGDCATVCPITVPDPFNEGLASRRAAYKLYPQAIPNAYAIEKRSIAPCRDACPAGQRAQGYIALIREGRYEDALRVIKEDNPFPGICGRICNHRCEDACNRGKLDEPLNIHALKRFVTDMVYSKPRVPPKPAERRYSQRVAIIGAGPCGLTAAQDLVKLGYGVTVFEALPVAGGMLRVGVPEYRLPSWIVDREVADIVDLGVDLRLNTTVENLDDIFAEGFEAVLIAVGAHEGRKLPIAGADLEGVLVNTIFLRDVRLGHPPEIGGKRVLVLGGGNVAIDVARTAVRLGAAEVQLACLESRETMPAHPWEIEAAEAEGVTIHDGRSFKRILDDGRGRVGGVECLRVTFMEFDAEGRLTLETEPGSEHIIPCDIVIFSIGQRAGLAFIPESAGVGTTEQGMIAVNPNTLAATRPGVFAAGDATTGTAFVIEAVANGHRVAESIHRYLRGEELEPPPKPELPVVQLTEQELQERVQRGELRSKPRVPMPLLPVGQRVQGFAEVEQGYSEEEAREEAARCLQCGICSECLSCVYTCKAEAINHDELEQIRELKVGAVILTPGYDVHDATLSQEYGFGRYPNVITSLQFERILSASGPYGGRVQRPSDGEEPKRIGIIQCVGSRDIRHGSYCSAVCCTYATKEALVAKDHAPGLEITIFYIDLRAFGKGFEALVNRAKEQGVRYIRSMVSQVVELPGSRNLLIKYADESGELCEEEFELVVLSVGLRPSRSGRELAQRLGIALNDHGFAATDDLNPMTSSRRGVFIAGAFSGPKDIPETVIQASAAAASVGEELAKGRGRRAREKEYPPERDLSGEEPRVGVFICHCGSNIASVIDVQSVARYAAELPNVVHAEDVLYACSQDNLEHMKQVIKEHKLNRVLVASCTPRTHEPLFQETIREAGLNKFLFEMADIREQCSWVHSDRPELAAEKAKALVRMGVGKARTLKPLSTQRIGVIPAALVIGGGLSGLTAALSLAEGGFGVHLIERERELGGNLRKLYRTLEGEEVQAFLQDLIRRVEENPKIEVYTEAQLLEFSGFVGNFSSLVSTPQGERRVEHGVVIVASGGSEHRPSEYLYGEDERVMTQLELERVIHEAPQELEGKRSIVMIQCVGSRNEERPYCSRVCCGEALKNALSLVERDPDRRIYVLYRDIMTYGLMEGLYRRAREKGVIFIRYDEDRRPQVQRREGKIVVTAWDGQLKEDVTIAPDLLVLSTGIVPDLGNAELGRRLKVPLDGQGFFCEAHVKLRPVDFASRGIFLCGLGHAPGLIPEAIAKAKAAAGRAATVLAKGYLETGGLVALVDPERCVGCLTCVRECPYSAVSINQEGVAEVEAALCQGCGVCAAECPMKAIQLQGFEDDQEISMLEELFVA